MNKKKIVYWFKVERVQKVNIVFRLGFFLFFFNMVSCINPFAPALNYTNDNIILGEQNTISGFFQCFSYSYNMKDTVVYGNLLADDFIFIYRNYDKGIDFSWTRAEDMLTTYKLFNAAQIFDFVWNEIVSQSGNDTTQTIIRSFDLSITFNPNDIVRVNGKVFFVLKRDTPDEIWKLSFWRDESYY